MMDSTNPNSIFAEYKKVIGQFKLPGMDVNAILESRRKDIEAIAEANTTALAGMQSIAKKQSEMLRSTLTEFRAFASRDVQTGTQPAVKTTQGGRQALPIAITDRQQRAG